MAIMMPFASVGTFIAGAAKRANPLNGTEFHSAGLALFGFLSLSLNPNFYANSSYLYPIDQLHITPVLHVLYFVVAVCSMFGVWITRRDTETAKKDAPDQPYNQWIPFLIRSVGFAASACVWLFLAIAMNASLLSTAAKTLTMFTPILLSLSVFSVVHFFAINSNFKKARDLKSFPVAVTA